MATPKPVLVSLLFYIGTLSATQTIYGINLLSLRWVALGTLTLVSFVYWLLGRTIKRGSADRRGDPLIVFIYLGATLLSVATAENFEFSGLRWLTQGMLILNCMVFLKGSFNGERIGDLLLPLKVITLTLLILSYFFPAAESVYDSPYFRGAMGDSNSLGHISAICALVYLQGAIADRSKNWRLIQFAIAVFGAATLIHTGARSSMAAFVVGLVLINFQFGIFRSLLSKAAMFLLAAVISGSPMLQTKTIEFIAKEERRKDAFSQITAIGIFFEKGILTSSILGTRERLWSEAWEGFIRRPFLGWGFGANADIHKEWSIAPTAIGILRDITNDLLFTLEGCGLVGLIAYVGLILSILGQYPTRQQLLLIRKNLRRESLFVSRPLNIYSVNSKKRRPSRQELDGPPKNEDAKMLEDFTLSRAQIQSQMYTLSTSLLVLFLFDGSAFSAGSLVSAIFWISAGAANLVRMEFVANERMNHRIIGKGLKGSRVQGRRDAKDDD